jgi:hypothetical protein
VKAADVARLPAAELRRLLASGHAVDPEALAGSSYLGRSLGLPAVVERMTWTWFRKDFAKRDADGPAVRGWNVRVEQDRPHRARRRGDVPWTFGHFEVVPLRGEESPLPVGGGGVLLDYGRGDNPPLDPTRAVRDPVVAVEPGASDVLLGWTYLRILGRSIATPSWFVLERDGAVQHVPPLPSDRHDRSSTSPR